MVQVGDIATNLYTAIGALIPGYGSYPSRVKSSNLNPNMFVTLGFTKSEEGSVLFTFSMTHLDF